MKITPHTTDLELVVFYVVCVALMLTLGWLFYLGWNWLGLP